MISDVLHHGVGDVFASPFLEVKEQHTCIEILCVLRYPKAPVVAEPIRSRNVPNSLILHRQNWMSRKGCHPKSAQISMDDHVGVKVDHLRNLAAEEFGNQEAEVGGDSYIAPNFQPT
jgi:hypothetical protein